MAKEIIGLIKLQVKGGTANPSPPVGPALGAKGVNIMEFCKQFNARTQDRQGKLLPTVITVYADKSFDFIMALGVIYVHSLSDAIKCLKEIQRVGKGKSFITLASYNNNEDYWLFKDWTVLGTTILRKEEWVEVLKHVNYTGDYFFTNAETLNLKRLNK